ncbi:MAG: winged helix-turn-helix domain-containing protein [Methanomassiliicoccales archaeon]
MRRNQMDIVKEILTVANISEVTKTQIVYKCNLSFEYAQKILSNLVDERLLELMEQKGKRTFKTTKKGSIFLKSLKEAYEIRSWNYEPE